MNLIEVPATLANTHRIALTDPVFISDLHLSSNTPRTLAAFTDFVRNVASRHAELVILGDLFEYWLGDDTDDATAQHVTETLAALHTAGHALFVMHGNRDLLLGAEFCAATGATLLHDPTVATIAGQNVLLAHGDAWCTADVAYQAFRAQVRNPQWQRSFLAQDLSARKAFVERARAGSESAKQDKSMDIMDVTPDEISAAFITHQVTRMVHGHTHRSAVHRTQVQGIERERWVLPDWDFDHAAPPRGGYLRMLDGAWVLESVPDASGSH